MSHKHLKKDRTCLSCKKVFHTDAKGIKDHAGSCARLTKLGMVVAGGVTLK